MSENKNVRTAGQAGWHISKYNIYTRIPDSQKFVVLNLIRGICEAYSFVELCLLNEAESLPENHPILERFAKSGFIANYDELEALKAMRRLASRGSNHVSFTICPTMNCNFACPYCFERHRAGIMTEQVQADIAALAEKMIDASSAKALHVTWFGGEPLLGMNVITALTEKLRAIAEKRNAKYSATIITNGYLLTQEIVDTLAQCDVKSAQITLDGIGEAHDQTRHLAGGGSTFERITENLRTLRIPFRVGIRHNIHKGNADQIPALRALIEKLAEESGNQLKYYPAPVSNNSVFSENGSNLSLLCAYDDENVEIGMARDIDNFNIKMNFCGANVFSYVGIDEQGRLYKCWEDVGNPEYSFGRVSEWDPINPVFTADIPDNLISYINASVPSEDEECLKCMFFPVCAGGCAVQKVRYGHRQCVAYKNTPEKYALALYENAKKNKAACNDTDRQN